MKKYLEIKTHSSALLTDDDYKDLILSGVSCSKCHKKLNIDEILCHKYVSITDSKDMQCQSCWVHDAYEQ